MFTRLPTRFRALAYAVSLTLVGAVHFVLASRVALIWA